MSYYRLNAVIKPFQFTIPRCDNSIITLEQGPHCIYQISADADSSYHQIGVISSDQEKLVFFAPDHQRYTFTVMPFEPCNAPPFYTAIMLNFKTAWDALFIIEVQVLSSIDGKLITRTEGSLFIDHKKLYFGSRTISDNILFWSNHLRLTILFFCCVCMVYQQYRVSFKLKKCEFPKDRTEYVGYDIFSTSNSPAQSKFNMINDWATPATGPSLHSFVALVNFHHRFALYLEIRLKPLRKFCKKYFRRIFSKQNGHWICSNYLPI